MSVTQFLDIPLNLFKNTLGILCNVITHFSFANESRKKMEPNHSCYKNFYT